MKAHLIFWAAVLGSACLLAGCQNLSAYSPAYQQAHETAFWQEYKGGGPDAMAVANLKAHAAAEKVAGR